MGSIFVFLASLGALLKSWGVFTALGFFLSLVKARNTSLANQMLRQDLAEIKKFTARPIIESIELKAQDKSSNEGFEGYLNNNSEIKMVFIRQNDYKYIQMRWIDPKATRRELIFLLAIPGQASPQNRFDQILPGIIKQKFVERESHWYYMWFPIANWMNRKWLNETVPDLNIYEVQLLSNSSPFVGKVSNIIQLIKPHRGNRVEWNASSNSLHRKEFEFVSAAIVNCLCEIRSMFLEADGGSTSWSWDDELRQIIKDQLVDKLNYDKNISNLRELYLAAPLR